MDLWIFSQDVVGCYWMLLRSCLGGAPGFIAFNGELTIRILLLGTFLTGNFLFMGYKASLTSELSVRERIIPFDSLKGFSESDYRCQLII